MSAIEYGSYYWRVILNGKQANESGESVHLHADDMSVDANGSLMFKSSGRRPAGGEPPRANGKEKGDEKKSGKDDQKNHDNKDAGMIYVAFAPGTWRAVYAAKLADGAPASIEHWSSQAGNVDLPVLTRVHAGAAGQPNLSE